MKYFLIAAVLTTIYLNRSYAYFYDFQGDHFIGNPAYPPTHLIQADNKSEIKKLAVSGDSLLAGTGSSSEENSLAYLIAQSLAQEQSVQLYNLASPGVGVKDVLERQVPEIINLTPEYVVLMIGINDIHNKMSSSEFTDYYNKILNELKNKTSAKVTIINIPYIGSNKILLPPWNKILNYRIGVFNKIISEAAANHQIPVVDLHKEFIDEFSYDSDLYAGDKFHPSDKGYALWAKHINSQISK